MKAVINLVEWSLMIIILGTGLVVTIAVIINNL